MKKICALLLLLCLIVSMLASCGPISTEGLLEAAPDLIARSAFYNDLYYGEGIPRDLVFGPAVGVYYYPDSEYLAEHGFRTPDELKARTAEVFSEKYSAVLFESSFSGYAGLTEGHSYARYCSSQVANLRDENETILVSSEFEPLLTGTSTYDYSTLRIADVGSDYARVGIELTVVYPPDGEHPDGHTVTEEILIRFVFEDGWRIDSATY